MTASTQDSGPETPVVRPAETASPASPTTASPGTTSGSMASGGTPVSSPSSPAGSRTEHANATGRAAADEARAAGEEAASTARSQAEKLKNRARDAVEGAKEQARSAVGEQKNRAADQLTGFADALRSASSELEDQGQTVVSSIVRHAADGIDNVSGAVRRRNIDDMVGSVESFARRQPAIFLGTAVLAGFGIARFLKSSSERRYEGGYDDDRSYRDPGYRHDPRRPSSYDRPADPGTPYGGTPYEGGL